MSSLGKPRHRRERGSATAYALVFIGLLTTLALVASTIAGLFVGHRKAAAAADVAALAGAAAMQHGGVGCEAAARISTANQAKLVSCAANGAVIDVEVALDVQSAFGASFAVAGKARAGPAGPVP